MTISLEEYLLVYGANSSFCAAAEVCAMEGIIVSGDKIEHLVNEKAVELITNVLENCDAEIVCIDDINSRKGDSSTSMTVFSNGETNEPILIIEGSDKEGTLKVLKKFRNVKIVSRDRDSAYSAASADLGLIQVADLFHLYQNIHAILKSTIFNTFKHDVFIFELGLEEAQEYVSIDYDEFQIQERINLANLTEIQTKTYIRTIEVINLALDGESAANIAEKLSITPNEVYSLRKNADKVIEKTEVKIDKNNKDILAQPKVLHLQE
jgi:hypothetical protein